MLLTDIVYIIYNKISYGSLDQSQVLMGAGLPGRTCRASTLELTIQGK